jgi:hypothetical protein
VRKKFILLTVLGALLMSLLVAAPAQADTSWVCANGLLCTYDDSEGHLPQYNYDTSNWHCVELGGFWDNRINSMKNQYTNGRWVDFYNGHGCTGNVHPRLHAGFYMQEFGPSLISSMYIGV